MRGGSFFFFMRDVITCLYEHVILTDILKTKYNQISFIPHPCTFNTLASRQNYGAHPYQPTSFCTHSFTWDAASNYSKSILQR